MDSARSANGVPPTLLEFGRRFADEDACRLYLARRRWPEGFGEFSPRLSRRPCQVAPSSPVGRWTCPDLVDGLIVLPSLTPMDNVFRS